MTVDDPFVGMSQRALPTNLAAETALLGAILANNRAFHAVSQFLAADHFADPIHGKIYETIARKITAGHHVDAVTLKTDFENTAILDEVGGTAYLAQLLTAMVGILNAAEYGRVIYDTWLRRQLIDASAAIASRAYGENPEMDGEAQLREASASLYALAGTQHGDETLQTIGQAAKAALAASEARHRGEPSRALLCGFGPVDKAMGGLMPGHLILLGGRPGHGKSALAMQIAIGVAELLRDEAASAALFSGAGGYVLVFSQEMSAVELAEREIARHTGIAADAIAAGELTGDRPIRLIRATGMLDTMPLLVDDCTGITATDLVTKIMAASTRYRVRCVVVDHLQKMRLEPAHLRQGLGYATSQITSGLKDAARRLGIPILALAQSPKEVDKRPDPRPGAADLMYGGEADADTIALIWRPEKYHPQTPPDKGERETEETYAKRRDAWRKRGDEIAGIAELIVAKRRGGPESLKRLAFDGATSSFNIPGIRYEAKPSGEPNDEETRFWMENGA